MIRVAQGGGTVALRALDAVLAIAAGRPGEQLCAVLLGDFRFVAGRRREDLLLGQGPRGHFPLGHGVGHELGVLGVGKIAIRLYAVFLQQSRIVLRIA